MSSGVLPPNTSASSAPSSFLPPAHRTAHHFTNTELANIIYGSSRHPNLHLFSSDLVQPGLEELGLGLKSNTPSVVVAAPSPKALDIKKEDHFPSLFNQDSVGNKSHTSSSHPVLKLQPSNAGTDAMLAINYSTAPSHHHQDHLTNAYEGSSLDSFLGLNLSSQIKLLEGKPTSRFMDQDLHLSTQPFTSREEQFSSLDAPLSLKTSVSSSNLIQTSLASGQSDISSAAKASPPQTIRKCASPSRPGIQPCPTCGKIFSNSSALTKHKLTHSDERKYICQLCNKAFKRQDHLNGHMLTHRSKKPFECDAEGCGKGYCDARSLRRHKENHHTASPPPAKLPAIGKTSQSQLATNLIKPYPTSVITSNSNSSSSILHVGGSSDRIQYAPPVIGSSQLLVLQKQLSKGNANTLNQTSWTDHSVPSPQNSGVHLDASYTSSCQTTTFSRSRAKDSETIVTKEELPINDQEHSSQNASHPPNVLLNPDAKESSPVPSEGGYMSSPAVPQSTTSSSDLSSHGPLPSETFSSDHQALSHMGSPLLHHLLNSSQAVDLMPTDDIKSSGQSSHHEWVSENLLKNKIVKEPNGAISPNIRALLEEKLNQKKNQNSLELRFQSAPSPPAPPELLNSPSDHSTFSADHLSPMPQENNVFDFSMPPSQTETSYTSVNNHTTFQLALDWQKEIEALKAADFRVPKPPMEKFRRHSDSDHFLSQRKPCTSYTNSALSDLLRRKVAAKRISRAGSDPGEPLYHNIYSSDPMVSDSLNTNFSLSLEDGQHHSQISNDLVQADLNAALQTEDQNLMLLEDEIVHSNMGDYTGMLCSQDAPGSQLSNNLVDSYNLVDSDLNLSTTDIQSMQSLLYPPSSIDTPVTSRSQLLPPPPRPVPMQSTPKEEEDSNDDVFLSPITIPTSPLRKKRKHKPEPLNIPPFVSTSGFTSHLRSPCLRDPEKKHSSPPPYTPPPMLSPVRTGSGLFWQIISNSGSLTPKSAPVISNFSLPAKKASTSEVIEDQDLKEAPETDILPHVNVGPQYQAVLPQFNPNKREAIFSTHRADKVWDPDSLSTLTEDDVDAYLGLSCSGAVPGGGRNKELALHLLHLHQGDVQEAMLHLMQQKPRLPANHHLLNYQYPETDCWSPEEMEAFQQALIRSDKDFYSIAHEIPSKSVKQCIQFYYLWKKVCPDIYRRLRTIRKKNVYSFDPQEEDATLVSTLPPPPTTTSDTQRPTAEAESLCKDPSSAPLLHPDIKAEIEYPCKICGKVFHKVKSRSAHMKSHSDKKTSNFSIPLT